MVAPSQPMIGKGKSPDSGVSAPRGPRKASAGGGSPSQGKLDMIQIISASAQREAPGSDINQFLVKLSAMIQQRQIKMLQVGNTVFMVRPMPNGVAEFHTFTVEPPESLVKRFQAGSKTLKQMGFKKAVSYTDNRAFGRLAQMTGLPVKSSPVTDPATGRPTVRYELDL